MPYVFDFDHKHAKSPMDMKDLLGGKGANLAEMTWCSSCPCGRFHHLDGGVSRLHGRWLAREPERRGAKAEPRLERSMARSSATPPTPFSSRCARSQVLHARHDGHVLTSASTTSRSTASPSRPVTSASPMTRTAASSPCTGASCSTCPASNSTPCSTPPKSSPARRRMPRSRRAAPLPRRLVPADRRALHRHAVPPGPRRSVARRHRGGVPQLERTAAVAYGTASTSPTTSAPPSTSRPWSLATATTTRGPVWASRATRRPARRWPMATSS